MIYYLRGKLTYVDPTIAVIDIQGVGYEAKISLITYSAIKELSEVKLFTHLHIKEDAHTLYGFFRIFGKEKIPGPDKYLRSRAIHRAHGIVFT